MDVGIAARREAGPAPHIDHPVEPRAFAALHLADPHHLHPVVVRVAGRVVRRQRPLAAAVFLTLEDEHGLIPLAVWPAQWERLKGTLRRSLVVVEGRVSRRDDTLNVAVQNAWPLWIDLDHRHGRRDWR